MFSFLRTAVLAVAGLLAWIPPSSTHAGPLSAPARLDSLPDPDVFTVATWNIQFFGGNGGPSNDALQLENVKTVLQTLKPDLLAIQEITTVSVLQEIVRDFPMYRYHYANYISQDQKLAFLYNAEAMDVISISSMDPRDTGNDDFLYDSAYRLPFVFRFTLDKGDQPRTLAAVNIHAKANTGSSSDRRESYYRRVGQAQGLYEALSLREQEWGHVILLGDFNDDLDASIYNNQPSPYKPMVDDAQRFVPVSLPLSQRRFTSMTSFAEMIDHVVATGRFREFVPQEWGSVKVHRADAYITDYARTTSDHYPVVASFNMNLTSTSTGWEIGEGREPSPQGITLHGAYPNPFNPTTRVRFHLERPGALQVDVLDVAGRRVARLADRLFTSGEHNLTLDAAGLPSGVYLIRFSGEGIVPSTLRVTLVR